VTNIDKSVGRARQANGSDTSNPHPSHLNCS